MTATDRSPPLRVWITDGSPLPFTDVHDLGVDHRGLLGLHFPYKGLVDPAVPRGVAVIDAARPDDALVGEAEWVVTFPDGAERHVADPEGLEAGTSVVLQGMIEGKWLNRLIGTSEWAPATVGNNLLAAGPGIPTTLGALEAGLDGTTTVEFPHLRSGVRATHVQSSTLRDLRGQNVLELVRAVLRYCRVHGRAVDAIDLGAVGARAAIVTEPERVAAVTRLRLVPVPNPLALLPSRRFGLAERVVRGILAEGLTALPGEPIVATVRDGRGRVVGEGALTWRAARS
jgi:hypothetical protein